MARWNGLRNNYGLKYGTVTPTPIADPAFNLRNGYPESDVFSTSEGCPYVDGVSSLAAELLPDAYDDGIEVQILHEPLKFADTEEIYLASQVEVGSVFEVRYYFHIADTYDMLARAKSPSDGKLEYVEITEVVSEEDDKPAATSGLFRGAVSGFNRQNTVVEYTDESGNVITNSKTPTPIPTPTPSVSPTATYVPNKPGNPTPTHTPLPFPTSTPTAKPRNLSVEFANTPTRNDDTVVFHIRDNYLGTTRQCTVKWIDIPQEDAAHKGNISMPWNVVTGDPCPNRIFTRRLRL